MMKSFILTILLSVGVILSTQSLSHAESITGTGRIFVSPEGGIIDDWFFTVTQEGTYDITVIALGGDPEINLFINTGNTLSLSDFIENDDDGAGNLNSYISRTLGAGDYQLRVSEYNFGNVQGSSSVILGDFNPGVENDWAYTLTIDGPAVAFTQQTPVPEPTTIMLFSMGLLGFAAAGRRRYQ